MNPVASLLRENWQMFKEINGLAGGSSLVDSLMIFGANTLVLLLPALLLLFWFALARWSPLVRPAPARGAAPQPRGEDERLLGQRMALLGVAAVGLALAFNLTLGHLIYEPRPFVSAPGSVRLLIPHVADSAFPSDHEAVASAVAATLALYVVLAAWRWLRRRLEASPAARAQGMRLLLTAGVMALVAAAAVLVIGVARVYVGVHYPGDIAGGVGCGILAVVVLALLMPLLRPLLDRLIALAEWLRLA